MANIIIPVYNAVDELKECLFSVLKNTDTTENKVIVINDCSPDEEVNVFLGKFADNFPQVTVLKNAVNIGFAATCNRGITEFGGDVILLNSDTLVTPNWVEKLTAAAKSDPLCATVTPLSNNATICSVPVVNAYNELPRNMSAGQLSLFIECANRGIYRRIPVGVGFCLYINRAVIEQVGLLDDVVFRDGYGEENDFCFRARAAGYHHLLACDTYVFHKGGASFLGAGENLTSSHEKYLVKKYFRYVQDTRNYVNNRPNEDICDVVDNIYKIYDFRFNKPFAFYIAHYDPFNEEATGGTECHLRELALAARDEYNIMVLYKHPLNNNKFIVKTITDEKSLTLQFTTPEWLTDEEESSYWLDSIINALLDAFPISFIHIQHWLGLSHDVFTVPIKRNFPFFVTLHDFFCLCPVYDFIPDGEHYCGFPESSDRDKLCRDCGKETGCLDYDRIVKRRKNIQDYLSQAVSVYLPTKAAEDIIKSEFKLNNLKVIGHGVTDVPQSFGKRPWRSKLYRVAMIGACTKKKGSDNFIEMVKLSANTSIVWHIFGVIADADVNEFVNEFPDRIKVHGQYGRGTLVPLLKEFRIDLIVIASIWPETFCYTLSEAFCAGIPVAGWDIGAVGERIRETGFGFLVPPFSKPKIMLKRILKFFNTASEYNRLLAAYSSIPFKTVEEMSFEYIEDYRKLTNVTSEKSYLPAAVKYIINNAEIDEQSDKFIKYVSLGTTYKLVEMLSQKRFATTLYYRSDGSDFMEHCIVKAMIPKTVRFDVVFTLPPVDNIAELRWDPVDDFGCAVAVNCVEINYKDGSIAEYPTSKLRANATGFEAWGLNNKDTIFYKDNNYAVFNTTDPMFLISGEEKIFDGAVSIRLVGKWNLLLR